MGVMQINHYALLSLFNYVVREQMILILKATLLKTGQTLWETNEPLEVHFELNTYYGFDIVLKNTEKYMNYEQLLEDLEATVIREWVQEFFGRSRDNIVFKASNVDDWFQVDVPSLKLIRQELLHVN